MNLLSKRRSPFAVGLVVIMCLAVGTGCLSSTGSTASAGTADASKSHSTSADDAYVYNGSGLVPFNLVSHSIGRAIPLPQPFLAGVPTTIDASGEMAYAIGDRPIIPWQKTHSATGGKVGIVPLNLATGAFEKPISKMQGWQSISIDASGKTICLAGGHGFKGLVLVNTHTGAASTLIPVPDTPAEAKISPDGRAAYVVTHFGYTITPVDLVTRKLGSAITVPGGVGQLAIAPDGVLGYMITNDDASSITPVDLEAGAVEKPIALPFVPTGLAISPDSRTVYVTGGKDLTSVDLMTGRVNGTFSIHGGAGDIMNFSS